MGVLYVKEGQYTEEEILDNNDNSPLFDEFLQILGDRVRLKGSVQTFPFAELNLYLNCVSVCHTSSKGSAYQSVCQNVFIIVYG